MKPDTVRWLIVWIVLAAAGYGTLAWFFSFDPLLLCFLALTAAAFLLVVLDKLAAIVQVRRVPELVLYIATFFGGSVGTLAGMFLVRHKSRKLSFQFVVGILVLIQLGFMTWYLGQGDVLYLGA